MSLHVCLVNKNVFFVWKALIAGNYSSSCSTNNLPIINDWLSNLTFTETNQCLILVLGARLIIRLSK